MKITRTLTTLFILLVLVISVNADVSVLSNIESVYNLNERFSLRTSISYTKDISGYIKVNADCTSKNFDYYVTPFDFKTTPQELIIPSLTITGEMVGNCNLNLFMLDLNNNLLNQAFIKTFEVSNKLNLNAVLEDYELSPGKSLFVKGDVKSIRNLELKNILLKITLNSGPYSFNLESSNIKKEIPINEDIKSGVHSINIYVEDGNGNSASKDLEFFIIAKPTSLKNLINKLEFLPGESIEVSSLLYDQAGDIIENDAEIKIFNSKNELITQGYNKLIYVLPQNSVPGTWIIRTFDAGFNIESKFNVGEFKKIDISLEDGTLYFSNLGNVNYEDNIEFSINGGEFSEDISLKPGEIKKVDLSKKVNPGVYDIYVKDSLEDKQFSQVDIPRSDDIVYLIGSAVDDSYGWLINKPALLILLLTLFIVIVFLVNRNKRIRQTKHEMDYQIANVRMQKLRKEKQTSGFQPKKFADMSENEMRDYRRQILKNIKEEKKREETKYEYKPKEPKSDSGGGLFNMFN